MLILMKHCLFLERLVTDFQPHISVMWRQTVVAVCFLFEQLQLFAFSKQQLLYYRYVYMLSFLFCRVHDVSGRKETFQCHQVIPPQASSAI